ncbi:MAG: enoyl-CoA hydratase-related protein, partial [Halopseudomonas sp.]
EEGFPPEPLNYQNPSIRGQWHCLMTQDDRAIDWQQDSTQAVLRKIRAADGVPGLKDAINGREYFLYNGHAEALLNSDGSASAGELIAQRDGAVCRATVDGAVWITHLRPAQPQAGEFGFKLPALQVLGEYGQALAESSLAPETVPEGDSWQQIRYREQSEIGYLAFDFYNGAMSTEQCLRLRDAVEAAKLRPIRVLVLLGGEDFWSNGIHLNQIEAAESAADESWANINAMNDLCLALIETPNQYVIAAMQGNAGAGGVFMALAADRVVAREGVILNPHYKSMGNLYGSEYWTYLLPKRVGAERAEQLTQNRLPISTRQACQQGLIDGCWSGERAGFVAEIQMMAQALIEAGSIETLLAAKCTKRQQNEAEKPLQRYRDEELERMKLNFYGFDPSYHVARYHFVEKLPKARTPSFLAHHRRS